MQLLLNFTHSDDTFSRYVYEPHLPPLKKINMTPWRDAIEPSSTVSSEVLLALKCIDLHAVSYGKGRSLVSLVRFVSHLTFYLLKFICMTDKTSLLSTIASHIANRLLTDNVSVMHRMAQKCSEKRDVMKRRRVGGGGGVCSLKMFLNRSEF